MSDSSVRTEGRRARRSLFRGSALLGIIVLALAVTLAACGGGSSSSDPSTTAGTTSSGGSHSSGPSNGATQQALKYASCMRSHGVTKFPDPTPGKQEQIGQSGLDTNSPAYQAAATACEKYLPRTGNNTSQGGSSAGQSQQLKFAECMRKHGVPKFPDPSSSGGQQSVTQYGINPNSPSFQKANQACSGLLSGAGG